VIGAGPTAVRRLTRASRCQCVQIIDSLEEVGGQCSAMYPEKYIYDVIGYPKVLAKIAACLEQALRSDLMIRLREQVHSPEKLQDGTFVPISQAVRRSRAVIIAAGSVRSSQHG